MIKNKAIVVLIIIDSITLEATITTMLEQGDNPLFGSSTI